MTKRISLLFLIIILLTSCKVYDAPNGGYFPYHWGAPPEIQTKDHVELPNDYGYGSSTLRHWIDLNLKKDKLDYELRDVKMDIRGLLR